MPLMDRSLVKSHLVRRLASCPDKLWRFSAIFVELVPGVNRIMCENGTAKAADYRDEKPRRNHRYLDVA